MPVAPDLSVSALLAAPPLPNPHEAIQHNPMQQPSIKHYHRTCLKGTPVSRKQQHAQARSVPDFKNNERKR